MEIAEITTTFDMGGVQRCAHEIATRHGQGAVASALESHGAGI